jgi:hypothetical protein
MRWVVLLAVLLFTAVVDAQEIATIPPGDDVIIKIEKGEPAPYRGHLYGVDTAIRWAFWLQQYKLRLKEDVEKEQRACKIKLDFKEKELRIEKDRATYVEKDLMTRLTRSEKHSLKWQDKAMHPSFFKTFEFGLIVGVAVTGAVSAALAWALNQK